MQAYMEGTAIQIANSMQVEGTPVVMESAMPYSTSTDIFIYTSIVVYAIEAFIPLSLRYGLRGRPLRTI